MKVMFVSKFKDGMVPFTKAIGKDVHGYPTSGKPAAKFKDGRCILDEEEDAETISMLRNHPENTRNRGLWFSEVDPNDVVEANVASGESHASIPKAGIQPEEKEMIQFLREVPASIPPNALPKAIEIATIVWERFNVRGVPKPTPEDKPLHIRSKIILILDALDQRGILNDSNSTGETSPGESKAKN